MTDRPTIGFIGLGIMGKPMAKNLLTAGYPLVAFNRSRGAVDELVAAGAGAATNPHDVALQSDVLITMLPDSPDVEAVMLGEHGAAAALREGSLWIDMSTIAPATTTRVAAALAERGIDALDAPVSGGEKGAIEDGIERRAARIWAPRWVGPMLALRGLVQPLMERGVERDPAPLAESLRIADPSSGSGEVIDQDPLLGVSARSHSPD